MGAVAGAAATGVVSGALGVDATGAFLEHPAAAINSAIALVKSNVFMILFLSLRSQ
jgi:hypothetical protein